MFNGTGIAKDEAGAAQWFKRAAEAGNPVAENRLARILMAGRGLPTDPVQAAKWHILAGQAGVADPALDDFVAGLSDDQRKAAAAAAKRGPQG